MTSEDGVIDKTAGAQRSNRLWFVLTTAMVLLVITLLPITAISLANESRSQSRSNVYDIFTGQEFDFDASVPSEAAFVNIAVTDLDETQGMVTLTVSGN